VTEQHLATLRDLNHNYVRSVGEADVSEDDHPYASQTGTLTVDRISDGFRTRTLGSSMRNTKFECIGCGMVTQR